MLFSVSFIPETSVSEISILTSTEPPSPICLLDTSQVGCFSPVLSAPSLAVIWGLGIFHHVSCICQLAFSHLHSCTFPASFAAEPEWFLECANLVTPPCFSHSSCFQGEVESLHGCQTRPSVPLWDFSGAPLFLAHMPWPWCPPFNPPLKNTRGGGSTCIFTTMKILKYSKFLSNITHPCVLLHLSLFSFPARKICVSHKYFPHPGTPHLSFPMLENLSGNP